MKIVVSACLLGENCKYNGGNNRHEKVLAYLKGHEVIAVCPEVLGGLSTPRIPSEIQNGEVKNRAGESVDVAFRRGAEAALKRALEGGCQLAILKARSPSCGVREIYDGSFSGKLVDGMGVFARKLAEAGIPMLDEEML